jgi:hypothetical protein
MRNVFTESLLSNGYTFHNMLLSSLTNLLKLPIENIINYSAL